MVAHFNVLEIKSMSTVFLFFWSKVDKALPFGVISNEIFKLKPEPIDLDQVEGKKLKSRIN